MPIGNAYLINIAGFRESNHGNPSILRIMVQTLCANERPFDRLRY